MTHTLLTKKVEILPEKFRQSVGLPFQDLLPATTMHQALQDEGVRYRQRLYTPLVILWAWLSPV
jgi:hypothetical protein